MRNERIEDLGKLSVLLHQMYDKEIFGKYKGRNKDFVEYFRQLTEDKQDDLLHESIYAISDLHDEITTCWLIARGDEE